MGGGGVQGGGPDTSRTIGDMPNITIFYGRPSWILAWEKLFWFEIVISEFFDPSYP